MPQNPLQKLNVNTSKEPAQKIRDVLHLADLSVCLL